MTNRIDKYMKQSSYRVRYKDNSSCIQIVLVFYYPCETLLIVLAFLMKYPKKYQLRARWT